MTGAPDMEDVVAEQAAGKKRSGIAWVGAGLIFALLIVGLLKVQTDVHAIETADVDQGKVIVTLSRDSQKLREALVDKGVNPDTIAPAPEKRVASIPGIPGVPGVGIVRVGISGDQLRVFYSDSTSQSVGPITGRPGVIGREGKPGRPGKPGVSVKGDKGDTGTGGVQGEPGGRGADATDQQVADAQAAYCATHNDCRGPAGADSTVPGPPAPTMTGLTCAGAVTPLTLTLTLCDGSTQSATCTATP